MTKPWNEKARLIYKTEQLMLPEAERDCPFCLGNGVIPRSGQAIPREYRPLYTGTSTCKACKGTGSYLVQLGQMRAKERRERFEVHKVAPGKSPKY